MRKQFFIPACVLTVAAICFIAFALGHPELSFPWSIQITHVLYALYVDVIVLLLLLTFWKKGDRRHIPMIVLELGVVFFLILSMFTTFAEGEANWYLPMALCLNAWALLYNLVNRKTTKKNDMKKREYR